MPPVFSSRRALLAGAFVLGLLAIVWTAVGFIGSSAIALAMSLLLAAVYLAGAQEIWRFRSASAGLDAALGQLKPAPESLEDWLAHVPAPLQHAVRQRVQNGRAALPGLALTPYLIGLLVMLGMLGTFLGMVLTFKGAVFALEGSADLGAIRGALAAPIKGLGLAFGTSVAGVASSAMLGLMSALVRRERGELLRRLDQQITTALRPFSLAQRQDDTLAALQNQASALPQVVTQLQALMEQVEQRHQQLDHQLSARQDQFHREAAAAYTELGRSVAQALNESLSTSARVAGESLQPVLSSAMAALAEEASQLHQRVGTLVQTQLDGLSRQMGASADTVAQGWQAALQQHERSSTQLVQGLGETLAQFSSRFDTQSHQMLAHAEQATAGLHREQTQALQRLLDTGETLFQTRRESEAQWVEQQGLRMDGLASLWQTELGALRQQEAAHLQSLRQEEAQRGEQAVQRLGNLQAALAEQLATLGSALEEPLSRLLQTASDAPRAAAELMDQLRQASSAFTERDQLALRERRDLLQQIGALLNEVQQTTGEHRAAIESLVHSATRVLDQTGAQFAQTLAAQVERAEAQSTQLASSTAALGGLGEAFQQGVQRFSGSNDKLMAGLQRVEQAIGQSMARSDEQLAYYVAQAREVIDLSISAQQGIVEDMRQLHAARPAPARAAAPAVGVA